MTALALLLALTPASAVVLPGGGAALEAEEEEEVAPNEARPELIVEVVFGEDLYVEKDLMLHGIKGYGSVGFSLPQSWELVSDPELHIYYEHSGELLPDQSDLTVLINDVAVGTAALDASNATEGVMVATVPRGSLGEYNKVTFAGTHRRTESCQDPYDMGLWTRVSRYSKLRFEVNRLPVVGELLEYPYPFFDYQGFGPMSLTWVEGESISDGTLTAAGALGLGLGRMADYRGVAMAPSITDLADATTHALLVGTPEEQPLIKALVDTDSISGDQGLIAVLPNPSDPRLAVLVVTGASDKGLMNAARALSANPRYMSYAGEQAVVSSVLEDWLPDTEQLPRPMVGDAVTLAQLAIPDQTVKGYYAPQFRVPILLEGDAAVKPEGGVARLNYGYSAGLDTRLSTAEVRLNGVTLRSVPLDDPDGETETTLRVRLPPEMVEPHSYLDVVFHLYPAGYDACEWHPDETHWATLYASSEIDIPHDNYAQMPDLSRLRFRGWPFNMESGDVMLVLADRPSGDEISAAFAMSARLGAWSVAGSPNLAVVTAAAAAGAPVAEHRLLLVGDSSHSWFNQLVSQRTLSAPGDVRGAAATPGKRKGFSYIEQVQDPSSVGNTLMVLRADDAAALGALVSGLYEGRTLAKLDRNLAVFIADGERIQTAETAAQVQVGRVPQSTRFRLLLQRHWATWGIIAVLGAMAFAGVVRGWARRRGGEV